MTEGESPKGASESIDLGNYEIIRARLMAQGRDLATRADTLNKRRQESFGGVEMTVVGNERVRTDNNCVPRDIVSVGNRLLFGFTVFMGLKQTTTLRDVLSLHRFEKTEQGFDLSSLDFTEGGPRFLVDERFQREFSQLCEFYKDARLMQLVVDETKLLAVFKTGQTLKDIRVFKWALTPQGEALYVDDRGERDFVFPRSHDFDWIATTGDQHVRGHHPHINILDEIFVETVGGDLTIKVEDNTESGQGIYAEPVDDATQSLDDSQFYYAQLGSLIVLKVRPYREEKTRHFVYNARQKSAVRLDAIGQSCVQLPEDHGLIFPGGYYLQTGDYKVFDEVTDGLELHKSIRSPNGEDVLYVFYRREVGSYVLYPYNLVRKEVSTPIHCNGYSLFQDGKIAVFRGNGEEPVRVHPIQIWQSPFVSAEFAADAPKDDSILGRIGNADLVRGISDCFTLRRLIDSAAPSRRLYEDLISRASKLLDSYYWLGGSEVGDFATVLRSIRDSAELIIDEFEKVQLLIEASRKALEEAEERGRELNRGLRPESWDRIESFLEAMAGLRAHRGQLVTLKEMRYIELPAIEAMEATNIERFDRVAAACIQFLLGGKAFEPVKKDLAVLLEKVPAVEKVTAIKPLNDELETLTVGLNLLAEVVSGLEVDDATQRTEILEQISEVFAQLNRVRATLQSHRKSLMTREGKAEFVAQFKLYGQSVASAMSLCDTPERCDEELSRLMLQLEELEGRFSEFDEFLEDLARKREEVYDAIGTRKQTLLDERQRRVQNLLNAADRILQGVQRRGKSFKDENELNAYFASDPMVQKLRQLSESLMELHDSVKADEVLAKLKSSRQDALRGLRDRQDLFEGGDTLIKLGRHQFSVNQQPLELTLVPRTVDGKTEMAVHLTGTDFYELVDDEGFNAATREYWNQTVLSENADVYRAEYLAALILDDAEAGRNGMSLLHLHEVVREKGLLTLVRAYAADRYEEGYERGVHDSDATELLSKLLAMRTTAGLLRFASRPRALAMLFWSSLPQGPVKAIWARRCASLRRLRDAFQHSHAVEELAAELGQAIAAFNDARGLGFDLDSARLAGRYLLEEIAVERPRFTVSSDAARLRDALFAHLDKTHTRTAFDDDLKAVEDLRASYHLVTAWLEALLTSSAELPAVAIEECAALILTERGVDHQVSQVMTATKVGGLLGNHPRISEGALDLRLDEFTSRLHTFVVNHVPGYRAYRQARRDRIEAERARIRLDEFMPRVMTSFVRNRLINEVYLPLIGDNLAKQLGASGESKRTDLMGLLLLISPPGYGKTTLMEYVANRLGLVFMKVNGPALGHNVLSLDPAEAPNATARQEVEKINLAFEMGNNVMLYLDDIQHTNPELLQKFISLCDAQRRVEGVWKGKTHTYDFRGKKFCVVMAGNPYTESGAKFQIPDMLANRADTYNLGDILEGKDDVFALSYVENAMTSNSVLAPLSTREYGDIYKIIRMAQGEEVPTTELTYAYSAVELGEVISIFKKVFVARDVLLKVNQLYIQSASMDDAFRTEPKFQLQGSYRNMSKLAEKIVPAMNEAELDALIRDHYNQEAQTLTTGAEHNLLKLAEMRGTLGSVERDRWEQIKRDYRRVKMMGGGDDDPVTRVAGSIGGLGEQLHGIGAAIGSAVERFHVGAEKSSQKDNALRPLLEKIEAALGTLTSSPNEQLSSVMKKLETTLLKLSTPKKDAEVTAKLLALEAALQKVAKPQLDVFVHSPPPAGVEELLAQQIAIVERTLVPLVRTSTKNLMDSQAIGSKLDELIALLKQTDLDLRAEHGAGRGAASDTIPMAAVGPTAVRPERPRKTPKIPKS